MTKPTHPVARFVDMLLTHGLVWLICIGGLYLLAQSGCRPAYAAQHEIRCTKGDACVTAPCLWDDTTFHGWGSEDGCPPTLDDMEWRCRFQFRDATAGRASVPWPFCTVDGSHQPIPAMGMGLPSEQLTGAGYRAP